MKRLTRVVLTATIVFALPALASAGFIPDRNTLNNILGPNAVTDTFETPVLTQNPNGPGHDPNFFNGFYWVHFTGSNTITPINIMAFYTITNLKTTTSRISNLSLEMSGAGGEWYGLDNLTTHQEIWAADMQHPTSVAAITLPEDFLMDKIANRNLAPGEPVMGWMLCQIPASYIPSGNNYARIRLRVEDTATDQKVQDFDIPQTSANVLSTEMQGRAAPGVDIRDYKIVPEGAFKPLVEK